MSFAFTDEQKLLADSVARFVAKDYPFEARRKLATGEEGWSRAHWRQFADLGWLAAPFSEEAGGLGGGPVEAAIVMEGFGKGLVVEPYLPSVILGGTLLASGGRRDLLAGVIEGSVQVSLAWVEPGARFDLAHVATKAERRGGGFVLSGQKGVAFNAATADWIVVPARTAGAVAERQGITLFLVAKGAKGLSLRPYTTIDGLRAAEVTLDGVETAPEHVLGEVDWGHPLLDAAIDRGIAAVCAEAAGIMAQIVALTRDYLKTRKQFGVPLASFQVLQHRAVDMYVASEQAQSMAYRAAVLADAREPSERARGVSAAKAWIGRAGRKLGQEAIQLHGGMGMTEEMPVSHYFKRLTMIDTLFGDRRFHRRRFAALGGFAEEA
ncbi:MAG: acyl-CoA dehydrogenase family protein [Rhodospirillaceae bacterium]|nr:acyl-CoA dehydrogenase family protein [Rhodospirillaceae bacterium]